MARWKLCASTTFEIFATFNLYTVRAKIPISPNGIQPIFEIFASGRRYMRAGHLGRKDSGAQVVLLLQWQGEYFVHRKNLKFCHFQPVHYASKNLYIFNCIQPIFEIFASARRCWGWAFGGKVAGAHVYLTFAMARWKLCASNSIWNFATFNLYTVPAKSQYLKLYSTDFRNLCLSSKMLRVGIWVESFSCPGILLLQWQGENFAHRQHLKFLPLSTCTLCQQKSYIIKGIHSIFEILASARRCWRWAFGLKVSVTQVF